MEVINKDLVSNSGAMNPPQNMPKMPGMTREEENRMMKCEMVYPEIFYRVQPYIMMVCDQMDFCSIMPSMEMVQKLSDSIYDDVCRMYPDMAEYARSQASQVSVDPPFDGMFGGRFRRRGLFRDIIDILLLSELFGRRRRRFF